VFATHHGQNGWVNLTGFGWRKIHAGASDGVTNMVAVFAQARVKDLKVTVNMDTAAVFQTYL
jgi:hypothetical protein